MVRCNKNGKDIRIRPDVPWRWWKRSTGVEVLKRTNRVVRFRINRYVTIRVGFKVIQHIYQKNLCNTLRVSFSNTLRYQNRKVGGIKTAKFAQEGARANATQMFLYVQKCIKPYHNTRCNGQCSPKCNAILARDAIHDVLQGKIHNVVQDV